MVLPTGDSMLRPTPLRPLTANGRIETRTAITISDPFLIAPLRGSENFVNLNSVVKVIAEREHNGHITELSQSVNSKFHELVFLLTWNPVVSIIQ